MARLRHVVSSNYGLAQLALVLVAVDAYELLRRSLRPDWPLALRHARDVAGWERVAHLAWEAPLQHAFLRAPVVVQALDAFYLAGHFVLTAAFFVWLYRRSRPAFRLFRNAFLLATGIALAVHWGFPTAPPRVAGVGLVDTLQRLSGIDIGAPGSTGLTDPAAAMPSLHAGWALGVGVGLVAYGRTRLVRVAGSLYPLAVTVTVVVTGNHFVLDAVAGMALTAAALALARLTGRRAGAKLGPATRGGAVR